MKKQLLTLLVFAIFTTISLAQVGINSDNSAPSPSAMLDVKSSDKGLLIPRMTTIERNAIASPEIGLMVFDKDLQELFIYNSDGWKQGTLSKIPLELSGNGLKILKVINTNPNSYPNTSTAAEFINNDILGYAIKAQSAGNPPTISATNEGGTGIEGKSNGFGYGGYFSSETGVAIVGFAKNNHVINGSNNSNTIPTAKFTNSGTGPAMELNSSLKVVTSNSIDDAAVRIQQTGIGGNAIYASSAGVSPTINIRATGPAPAVYGNSNTAESGYFESTSGRAVVGSTGNNHAFSGFNNSSTLPTAKFTNLGTGPAMELNSFLDINVDKPYGLKIINNSLLNTPNSAAEFIHNGPYGNAILGKSFGSGNSIEGRMNGVGAGIAGFSNGGPGGYFSSETNVGIIILNNSLNLPTAKIFNSNLNGTALELQGNLQINGKILNEAYQTPNFENNWTNFGGEWNTAKFYKGKDGRVYLEGVVTGGSSSVICTLPVGYRPVNRIFFMVSHDGNGRGRIDIQANGIVSFDYGANRTQVGLDGISFRVD